MLRRIAAFLASTVLASAVLLSGVLPARADPPEILPFADVPADAWYYPDVLYAYQTGLVNGRSADVPS